MAVDEIKEKIRTFLLRYIRKSDLRDDDDFFSLGFVNSLFALQLVMFVEKEFKFKVENEDLDLKNFNSISAITAFISRKTSLAGSRN